MKQRLFAVFLFIIGPGIIAASGQSNQYGLPFITNYPYNETGGSEQNWCITQDHRGVVYVGNQEKGVLEFDGVAWRTIPLPNDAAVLSMTTGDDGVVYVGASGDFGMLEPNANGKLIYHSLSNSATLSDLSIGRTYYEEDKVYFCDRSAIFVYDPGSDQLDTLELPGGSFRSYIADHKLYATSLESGLLEFNGEKFEIVPGGEFFIEKSVSGMDLFGPGQLLVSTKFNGMYLLNTETGSVDSSFLNPALWEKLQHGSIESTMICDNNIFICTEWEGLIILDRSGSIKNTISLSEGLIDNTINQVYISDRHNGSGVLWLAHWAGVSKVELNSPFRSGMIGSTHTGFSGTTTKELITDIEEFNGGLVVSTKRGIYRQLSNREGVQSVKVPGIEGHIYDLQVITPSAGVELLLASGFDEIFIIDDQMGVTTIRERMINLPDSLEVREQISGQHILYDPEEPDILYCGQTQLVGLHYQRGAWEMFFQSGDLDGRILHMVKDKHDYFWVSSYLGVIRLDISDSLEVTMRSFTIEDGLPSEEYNRAFINPETNEVLMGTEDGFFRYNYFSDTFFPNEAFNGLLPMGRNTIHTFYRDRDGDYWLSFENQDRAWTEILVQRDGGESELVIETPFLRLSSKEPVDVFFSDSNNEVWFSKSNRLYHYDKSDSSDYSTPFQVLLRNVEIPGDSSLFYGALHPGLMADAQPQVDFQYNTIEFQWSAPYFEANDQTQYSYILEGFDSEWSAWDHSTSAKYANLKYGEYEVRVKARNVYGQESPLSKFSFRILNPWYTSIAAISVYVALLGLLVLMIALYTRNLRKRAKIFEKKNRKIEAQKKKLQNLNKEISAQRDEIEAQRDSIQQQKDLIVEQKRSMTDGILYARKIQDAVLPAKEVMNFLLPKHFVFYRPQQIVSGDFFWVDKKNATILLALGDCTGHGVPGAFMSMLGTSLLNEISNKYANRPTNELMDELRDQLITSLGQTGGSGETKDGMDMGLVAINTRTRKIQFTGAHHNLYIFRKGVLEEVKGDRMPVGIHTKASTLFTTHNMKLNRGDSIYLLSDGFPDQFGGEKGKKYGYPRLKSFLGELQEMIMFDQLTAVSDEFDRWKGDEAQIDDVLMIGVKL
ncbi:MAG: SpoIIE family protein phosphatase [Bacteroidota bacterium]